MSLLRPQNSAHFLLPFAFSSPAVASFSTSSVLAKNVAGKWYNKRHLLKRDQVLQLTYDMWRRPHHIGHHKAWMAWNTQNLKEFEQQPGLTIAQDEVIRRFCRALLFDFLPEIAGPTELVIKRRGNCVFVSGFLCWKDYGNVNQRKLYWLWGFTEELLSNLLKQPVKLELQFVRSMDDVVLVRIRPSSSS
uniref:EOG090X0I3J n=1 Tax=Globodera pallida TaxID=36090 RepID=A0A183C745_GLOPA